MRGNFCGTERKPIAHGCPTQWQAGGEDTAWHCGCLPYTPPLKETKLKMFSPQKCPLMFRITDYILTLRMWRNECLDVKWPRWQRPFHTNKLWQTLLANVSQSLSHVCSRALGSDLQKNWSSASLSVDLCPIHSRARISMEYQRCHCFHSK